MNDKAEDLNRKSNKSRSQKQYSQGQHVMIKKEDKKSVKATIVKENAPRSYIVRTEQGKVITKNQKHLREDSREKTLEEEEEEEEETENKTQEIEKKSRRRPKTKSETHKERRRKVKLRKAKKEKREN